MGRDALKDFDELLKTMDSHTRIGMSEYYRKLHIKNWFERLTKIRNEMDGQ